MSPISSQWEKSCWMQSDGQTQRSLQLLWSTSQTRLDFFGRQQVGPRKMLRYGWPGTMHLAPAWRTKASYKYQPLACRIEVLNATLTFGNSMKGWQPYLHEDISVILLLLLLLFDIIKSWASPSFASDTCREMSRWHFIGLTFKQISHKRHKDRKPTITISWKCGALWGEGGGAKCQNRAGIFHSLTSHAPLVPSICRNKIFARLHL